MTTKTTMEPDVPEPHDTDLESTVDDETEGRPANEAARYRRRLRDTEVERDLLREQLSTMHDRLTAHDEREVRQMATAVLADPSDLYMLGGLHQSEPPLDDDGNLDVDAVQAAIDALATGRPELTRDGAARATRVPKGPPARGQGTRLPVGYTGSSWDDVLRR